MIKNSTQRDEVVNCLLNYLDQGVPVCRETLFFAESALGLTGEELASVLAADDASADELLALAFSPTDQLRRAVERAIGSAEFTVADSAAVTSRVAGSRSEVTLLLEGAELSVSLPLSVERVAGMVDRLAMHRQLDDALCAALARGVAEEQMIAAQVAMRTKNVKVTPASRELLCRFVERAGRGEPLFDRQFELLLTLTGELSPGVALERYLFEKRELLVKTLQELDAFARRKEQYGMEYLLMQRCHIPHESADEARDQLLLLDRIIFDVLGLTLPPGSPVQPVEFDLTPDDEELARMLRTLI